MINKKRVLVVAGGNYISGAEKITLDVIEGLTTNGYPVHCLVSGWNDGKYIAKLRELGVRYTVVKLGWYYISKVFWSLDSLLHYPNAIFCFLQLRKRLKPDVIYTISYRQIVLLFPFIRNASVVYNIQDPNKHSRASRFFLRLIDKKVLKYTACSESIKQDLKGIGINDKKIDVIYNGVDLKVTEKISFDKVRIGIVGQLIHRKGHFVLLEAAKLLRDKFKIQFVINIIGRGDPDYKRQLLYYIDENDLQEYVHFVGHIENTQEIYKHIDITVVPSFAEAFGLIAVESYFNKIPVIASNVGGLQEIIINEKTGYLFPPGNVNELANKIFLLYQDPDLVESMVKEGYEYCRSNFTKTVMIKKVLNLFENL